MELSTERLLPVSSGDDDSDVDLVTDYLITNSTNIKKNSIDNSGSGNINLNQPTVDNKLVKKLNTTKELFDQQPQLQQQQQQYPLNINSIGGFQFQQNQQQQQQNINIPLINVSTSTTNNMLPIISITPHSPGAKYYSILEESIMHLQSVRDSVVYMKNSSEFQIMTRKSLSLPNLSPESTNSLVPVSTEQQYLADYERKQSITITDSEINSTKNSRKSISLTNLKSEDQEPTISSEKRSNRDGNTVGISTHSLNEAELAGDFQRIQTKRNLTPAFNFYRNLRKSLSASSISPTPAKEENAVATIRHLSDSDDDNQDDRTLLCVTDKTEAYGDHSEKRRKRGSLFFGKKKDKTKSKTQSQSNEPSSSSSKSGTGKKNSATSYSTHHHDDSRDYYDGYSQNEHSNWSSEIPSVSLDFSSEPPVELNDLSDDPILGIDSPDPETWSLRVPKDVLKSLKPKEIKRQEHIYEFIMTEKHHCQTLLVIQKVFVEGINKYFSKPIKIDRLFPRLGLLTQLHTHFLKQLRIRQSENYVVSTIADIIVAFFSGNSAEDLKLAYGQFCSNHNRANEEYRICRKTVINFDEWHKHCITYPVLKKKGIPECILFVTQRLTKYPLLIEPLIKNSREDRDEKEKLEKAMELIKDILNGVNDQVAENEKSERQYDIFIKLDTKTHAMYKNKRFRKSDICLGERKLKFEGQALLMQKQSKPRSILVVVLTDCLCFLQDTSQNKYTFFTPENKEGVVPLKNLLVREKAEAGSENRGLFLVSSNLSSPEIYELRVEKPRDVNIWIREIKDAVSKCPSDEEMKLDEKQANIREIIDKMREKDLEQALLLEEKIKLQINLLKEKKNIQDISSSTTSKSSLAYSTASYAEDFMKYFGTYKDLITDDCDTIKVWERVLNTIKNTSQLAATLYNAATEFPVSRSVSSVGEKQSDAYSLPALPKRAETFGGFDEKRNKNLQWKDAVLSTLPLPTTGIQDKNENLNTILLPTNSGIINSSLATDTINSSLSVNRSNSISSGSNLNNFGFINNNLINNNINNLNNNNNNSTNTIASSLSSSSHASRTNTDNIQLSKDQSEAALQVSHNLHTLLCIISQQMTTIEDLQSQLLTIRTNKLTYKYNDQLEELRNLQDKIQEEKHAWLKEKEQKEIELEERSKSLELLKKQIKTEQEDIKQQREQLYKKMKLLSNQGILLSPNTPLTIANVASSTATTTPNVDDNVSDEQFQSECSVGDKRKDRWKSAPIAPPPVNLLSATNATKVNQTNVKQQIPIKLSSSSSTKSDKSPNFNNTITSPINSSGGITQMLPLKLADKKANQNITPSHSRTGSSPAVIQQPSSQQFGNPAIRTNTYPKLPEKYKVRTSDIGLANTLKLSTGQNQNLNNKIISGENNIGTGNDCALKYYVVEPQCPRNKSIGSAVVLPSKRATGVTEQSKNFDLNNRPIPLQSSSTVAPPTKIQTNTSSSVNVNDNSKKQQQQKHQQQQQQKKSSETDEEEIYF